MKYYLNFIVIWDLYSLMEAPKMFFSQVTVPLLSFHPSQKMLYSARLFLRIVLELGSSSKWSRFLDPTHGSSIGFLSPSFSEKRRERKRRKGRGGESENNEIFSRKELSSIVVIVINYDYSLQSDLLQWKSSSTRGSPNPVAPTN